MAAAAASRSHATTDGKISQRNVENPILSSMIYEGGLQPHAGIIQSWVDSIRYTCLGLHFLSALFMRSCVVLRYKYYS